MSAYKTTKKTAVWKKNPIDVEQPVVDAIVKSPPSIRCVSLKVSGFATRKKTRVE
jgi:hypothetical protein